MGEEAVEPSESVLSSVELPPVVSETPEIPNAFFQQEILSRLDSLERTVEGLRGGVNMIGEMMNAVSEMFRDMVQKVNSGGIGALLGNFMGKNNG